MANDYYVHGSYPATGAQGSSSGMRSELDAITAAFDKMPTLTGNGGKIVAVNAGATALEATATPTVTSINKVTITQPASGATLTLVNGSTLATAGGAFSATLTMTGATNVTLPTTGTLATLAGSETLTNKTNSFASNTFSGTLAANRGGTGNASYAIGDIIQASAATTLSALPAVATGNVLLSGGVATVSAWGKVGLTTHVSGSLPVANGGTGATTASAARTALAVAPQATRIDVASVAGTVDLTTNAPDTDDIRLTGNLAITAFTIAVGRVVRVTASGTATLANNASIVTQTGATLALAANDTFILRATAANVVEVLSLSRGTGAGTKVALTSGTTADSSAVAPWAKKISGSVVAMSGNGTSLPIAQFIVAGSPVATGYTGGTFVATTTPQVATQAASTGIPLAASGVAAGIYHGGFEMELADSATNTWKWSLAMWRTDGGGNLPHFGAGTVALAGVPTAVRLTFANGTDAFDGAAGAFFNINYYG